MSNILQGLHNKPFQAFKDIISMKNSPSLGEIHDNEPKHFQSKDESYNYLINMKIDKYLSSDFHILKVMKNKNNTIIITKKIRKKTDKEVTPYINTIEIIVTENVYNQDQGRIRYHLINKMVLNIIEENFPFEDLENDTNSLSFFHVCQKFIIINTKSKVIIADYNNQLYSTIFTKNIERSIHIFYTYDELIGIDGKILNRSYVFGFNQSGDIYYFTIDDTSFDNTEDLKKMNIVMKKLNLCSDDKIRDLKVIKIYSSQEKRWFYLICYLKEREFVYYITEYVKSSLQTILERIYMRDPKVYRNIIELQENKFKMKKISDFYNQTGVCSIIISNGDDIILIEYDSGFTPFRMKQLLDYGTIDSQRKNLSGNLPSTQRENNIISEDVSKYFAFSLHQYSIDYDNYAVMYEKHKLCFVSKKQIILTNINKGQNYYIYTLKDDDQFVEFFKYDGIQHLFVYTNKKIFRFRFIFRYKTILDINKALKEIQTNHANEKNNRVQRLDKFQNFDLKEYDSETYEKCLCFLNIYIEQVKRKSPTCFYCMLKGEIICQLCKEFQYCSKLHQDCEWRLFHFFECNLLQLFTKVKEFGKHDSTRFFYHNFKKYFGNILIELLKFCKDSIDFQEHIIYIHFLLEILERFDILSFFKNIFIKVLNITKPETKDGKEKTSLQIDKALLLDTVFYYFSLKLFYSKFCIESQYCYVAYNNLSFLKDQMQILKQESSSKQLRNILNIRVSIHDIEAVTPSFLQDDVYQLLSINKYNKTITEEVVRNEKNQDASLYDKFFYFITYFKSTIFKYNLKLDTKKEDLLIPFIHDVLTIFDNTFQDNNIIFSYLYFYFCFYLVEDDKFYSAINLLNKTLSLTEEKNYELKSACLHNLGMLNYSVGNVIDGIHELEEAYRLNVNHNLSTNTLLHILDHLSLAYIEQKSFRKAYSLLQQSISMRSLSYDEKSIKETVKLKFLINFIIDYIEYNFTLDKKHSMWNTSANPHNKKFDYEAESENLIQYVLSNFTDVKQPLDLYTEDFLKLTEFLYNLTSAEIKFLNDDNNLKIDSKNQKEQQEHLITTQTLLRESNRDQVLQKELNNDIEIKKTFFNNLNPSKQEILKSLNITLLKRNIVLRDSKGPIDHFNLNYHPIHTKTLQKIIDNIRSNFFVQEVSKTEVLLNKFERNLHNRSVLISLSRYLDSQDINYAVVVEKFKQNPEMDEKLEIKSKEISTNRSQKKGNKKMDYSIFLVHMMEKLEMQDNPDQINDLLFQVYNFLNEDEVNYMAKFPELLLNFIHNDTKVFELGNEIKKNKGQELYEKLYQNEEDVVQTPKSQRRSKIFDSNFFLKIEYPSNETEDIKKSFYKKIINFFSIQRKTKSSFDILNNDFTVLDESAKARKSLRRSHTLQDPKGNVSQTDEESEMQVSISNMSSNLLNNIDNKKKKSINLTEKNGSNRVSILRETPMKRGSFPEDIFKFQTSIVQEEEMNLRDPNTISSLNQNDHKLNINEFHNDDLDFFSNTIQKLKEITENDKNKSNKIGNINLVKSNKKGMPKLESSTADLHIPQTKIDYIKKFTSPQKKNKNSSVDRETSTKKSPNFAQSSYNNDSVISNKRESKVLNDSNNFKHKNSSSSFKRHNLSQNDIETSPSKFSLKREFTLNQNKNSNKQSEEVMKFESKLNNNKTPSENKKSQSISQNQNYKNNSDIHNNYIQDPSPVGVLGKYMASKPVKNVNSSIHKITDTSNNTGLNFVFNINKSLNLPNNNSVYSQKAQNNPISINNNIKNKESNNFRLNPTLNNYGPNSKHSTQDPHLSRNNKGNEEYNQENILYTNHSKKTQKEKINESSEINNKDNSKSEGRNKNNYSKEINEAISNPPEKKFVNGGGVQYTVKRNSNEPRKNMNHNLISNNNPLNDSPFSSVEPKDHHKNDERKCKNESISTVETPYLKKYNETINSQRLINTSDTSQHNTLVSKNCSITNNECKKTGKFGKEKETKDQTIKASCDTYFETRNVEANSREIVKQDSKKNKKSIISLKGYTKKNLNRSVEGDFSYCDFKRMKRDMKQNNEIEIIQNYELFDEDTRLINKPYVNNTSNLNIGFGNLVSKKNQINSSALIDDHVNNTEIQKFNLNVSRMNESMINITEIKRSNINTSGVNENLTITNADEFFATKNNFSLKGEKPNLSNFNKQSLQDYPSNNNHSNIITSENLYTNHPCNTNRNLEKDNEFKKNEGTKIKTIAEKSTLVVKDDLQKRKQQEFTLKNENREIPSQLIKEVKKEKIDNISLKIINKIFKSPSIISQSENLSKNTKENLSQPKYGKKRLEDYFDFDAEFKDKFIKQMPVELQPIAANIEAEKPLISNSKLEKENKFVSKEPKAYSNSNNLNIKEKCFQENCNDKNKGTHFDNRNYNNIEIKKNIKNIISSNIDIESGKLKKCINHSKVDQINDLSSNIIVNTEAKEEINKNSSIINSNNYYLSDFSLNFDSNKPNLTNNHNLITHINDNKLIYSITDQSIKDPILLKQEEFTKSNNFFLNSNNIHLSENILNKDNNIIDQKESNLILKENINYQFPKNDLITKEDKTVINHNQKMNVINEIIESSNSSTKSIFSESKYNKKIDVNGKKYDESKNILLNENLCKEREVQNLNLGAMKSNLRNLVMSSSNSIPKNNFSEKDSYVNIMFTTQSYNLNSNPKENLRNNLVKFNDSYTIKNKSFKTLENKSPEGKNKASKRSPRLESFNDKQTSKFLSYSERIKYKKYIEENENISETQKFSINNSECVPLKDKVNNVAKLNVLNQQNYKKNDEEHYNDKIDYNNLYFSNHDLSNVENTLVYNENNISNHINSNGNTNNNKSNILHDIIKSNLSIQLSTMNINTTSVPQVPTMIPGVPGMPQSLVKTSEKEPSKIPVKTKVKPKANMKPLYWNIIDPKNVSATAWGKIDDSTVQIESSKLEEEFSIKKTVNDSRSADRVLIKSQANSTLTSQRQQNINLVLSKVKMNETVIVNALKKYDLNKLSLSICELLLSIIPTENEINNIKLTEDPSKLAECDKFILALSELLGYDLRIKSIIFKNIYEDHFKELEKKINRVNETLDFFKNDERVFEWLKIVLAYGNYLNGTSSRGGAFGFKLDTLNKLTELKSNDNKKTLITFIVESILDKERPEMFEIKLKSREEDEVTIENLRDLLSHIKKSFVSVQRLKDFSNNITDIEDKTSDFLSSFIHKVNDGLMKFEQIIEQTVKNYERLCNYYGEDPKLMSYDQFIDAFNKFFENIAVKYSINQITKENCLKQRVLKQKQQLKKK